MASPQVAASLLLVCSVVTTAQQPPTPSTTRTLRHYPYHHHHHRHKLLSSPLCPITSTTSIRTLRKLPLRKTLMMDNDDDDDQAPEPYHERHQVHQNARAEAQVTLEALLELAKKPTCIPHLLQGKHSPGSDEDCLTHKVRCFTCAANHLHCDIITPRENAQDVCFVCRLPQNVLFRLTHTSEQFGKPRACPFRSLTRSLMRLHDSHTLTFTSTLSRQQAFEFLISRDAYGLTNASTIFAKLTNKK